MFIQSYCSLSSTQPNCFFTSVILLMIALDWATQSNPDFGFAESYFCIWNFTWNETSYIFKGWGEGIPLKGPV